VEGARVVSNSTYISSLAGSGIATENAIVALTEECNVLFVTSAGNAGGNVGDLASQGVDPPQRLNNARVITVGATELIVYDSGNPLDVRSSFSNYGPSTVDIMAPGSCIRAFDDNMSGGGSGYVSGTSFSAPMVAAAAAVYRSQNPQATAIETRQALLNSCASVPLFDSWCECAGRLDVAALLGL
jgi:subtilisin family serine protease